MKQHNIFHILFSTLGMSVVLWHLLGSGYVLTLDMIFGPHVNLTVSEGTLTNTLPLKYLIAFLTLIFNGWIAQKILIITIFFSLFYFPLHFFKKVFTLEDTHGAEYVASLFFAINPFVYERFLAGQWNVLFGYALLIPITAYLITFCRQHHGLPRFARNDGDCDGIRNTAKLALGIIVLGAVSTHFLIIAILIIAPTIIATAVFKKGSISFIQHSAVLALSVLMLSSYWLVPAFLAEHGTPLPTFTSEHWEVFSTAGNDSFGGVVGNVLSLHGFWGEHEPWIRDFALPKDSHTYFILTFSLCMSLVLAGIYFGFKDTVNRNITVGILFFTLLSVVFSSGVGDSVFKSVNTWLFENISFWKGFRDTQKWSGVIALGYALFAGLGAKGILTKISQLDDKKCGLLHFVRNDVRLTSKCCGLLPARRQACAVLEDEKRASLRAKHGNPLDNSEIKSNEDDTTHKGIQRSLLYVLLSLPLFYTPMMLFGFSGQLHTVHYPSAWEEVDVVLRQDEKCKALFLPWHQYYSLDFNKDTLTANPARSFFTCDIVHGKNMELGTIESQCGHGEEYERVESVVTDNEGDMQSSVDLFRELGIKYIIFTDDLIDEDIYAYPFLFSEDLQEVMHRDGVYLYIVSDKVSI